MAQIPTAEKFLSKNIDYVLGNDCKEDVENAMIEFAKLHVKAALEASANEYYPKDKENFELLAERFINAYSLENIK
jgi:hypothetical protein